MMTQKAIGDVFAVYRERMARFIRKRVRLLEDAEDILQDVFYEYSRIHSVDSIAQPVRQTAAWLYRVARNKIINRRIKKKETAWPTALSEYDDDDAEAFVFVDIADTLFGEAVTPETEGLRKLIAGEIQAALAELPETQRLVFELSEFRGMAMKDIAEKTGVPLNTALSRKHYAVTYLRKRLKELYADVMEE
jgi:RNA polymerase sigma factor (sigma-70 family)